MIALKAHPVIFWMVVFLLLGSAYVVFRLIVRRDYRLRGHLTWLSSSLQLVIFTGLMSLPYLFNPPEWIWFWRKGLTNPQQYTLGMVIIIFGFIVAFGTMAWFGVRRAFGFEAQGLITTGPYRMTRNPQILGGYLLLLGVSVQYPSWFAAAWIVLYGLIGHWMILTEEEHLRAIFVGEYSDYCEKTPRYLFASRKPQTPGIK